MSSLEEIGNNFEQNPGRTLRRFAFKLFGLLLLLGTIFWVVRILSVPGKVIEKTLQPDNIIYNYEWFKQEYQDWNAINVKCVDADSAVVRYARLHGDPNNWPLPVNTEYSRLSSIADGLKYQRADIVSQYNAHSQMVNRNIFKTGDLPDQLPQ